MKYMQSILLAFLVGSTTSIVFADDTKTDTSKVVQITTQEAKDAAKKALETAKEAHEIAKKEKEEAKIKASELALKAATEVYNTAWRAHHTYLASIGAGITTWILGGKLIEMTGAEGWKATGIKAVSAGTFAALTVYLAVKAYNYATTDELTEEDYEDMV